MEQLDPGNNLFTKQADKVKLRLDQYGRAASITSRIGHQYVTANCSLTFTPLVSLRDD